MSLDRMQIVEHSLERAERARVRTWQHSLDQLDRVRDRERLDKLCDEHRYMIRRRSRTI